jgi:hypothetical protein
MSIVNNYLVQGLRLDFGTSDCYRFSRKPRTLVAVSLRGISKSLLGTAMSESIEESIILWTKFIRLCR